MTITHTDIYRFSIKMEPFTIATGTMHFAQNVFLRIHTDEGIYGVGECSAFPMIVGETQETCVVMAKDFAQIWKGKSALDIPVRMQDLDDYCARNTTIKSAFNIALYDLAAKAANLPLYKFLGGTKRTIETDITIGIGTPGAMAEAAKKFKESGAGILKIKLGKQVKDDLERITKIRGAVGRDMQIRIDANQAWTFEAAVYALQGMAGLDIQFCEQPMRSWNDHRLPELREKSPVKIMADESCYSHHDAKRLIDSKSCHYLNIKFSKSGGITEAIKIHDIAAAANIPCMMGGMLESRLALSAKLHFVYASPNIQFYDMDTCMIGHLEDPVTGGITFNGYFPDIANEPGIGADVDETFLKNCDTWTV
jgi:L-alanine-DL-glutamate epimerase-like enolase superfamily enzyme